MNRILLAILLFAFAVPAQALEEPLFSYTHQLPSPGTLPAGRLVIGTSAAVGITDFFQVGSDLIRDFYQVYNANGKLSILDYDTFASALTLGWEHFNLNDIDSRNPDLSITSWQPGMVTSFLLHPQLAWFVGGNLNFTNVDLETSELKTSGAMHGFELASDLSWAYNPKKKGIGNVLSSGVSYDFTYHLFGVGISHHWPGFHLGFHYYPNATKYKLQPIIAGGIAVDI
jgi:hypothetical protein